MLKIQELQKCKFRRSVKVGGEGGEGNKEAQKTRQTACGLECNIKFVRGGEQQERLISLMTNSKQRGANRFGERGPAAKE
jgi:hypothetical protein